MASQVEGKGGIKSVVQFKGVPIERIDFTNQQLARPNQQERYYLAAPTYRSSFGVEGYLLMDHHPEERWHSYTEGDCIYIPYRTGESSYCNHDVPPTDDPVRLSHFFNTGQGFKLVRFFHLPEAVAQAFGEDTFSGDHLIEKCTSDRTLPNNFDEVQVALKFLGAEEHGALKSLGRALTLVNPAYSELTVERYLTVPAHRVYFSFHPWPWYNVVIKIGEESIIKALINFDSVLERMNPKVALERRELILPGAESTPQSLPLPPAYQQT